MTADARARAVAIRAQVAALELVACRMAHERVRWDRGQIVRRDVGGAEGAVARVPLCGHDTRAQRLGCGHTPARDALQRALAELGACGALSAAAGSAMSAELHQIGHAIQLLDHQKGDAEKRHALLVESRRSGAASERSSLDEAAADIRALEREHGRYVEQLRYWRDRLLRAVDSALAGMPAHAVRPRTDA